MIQFEAVTKKYSNHNGREPSLAVHNASLHVAPREFVCVVGPSGCGKSTLLNLVAGFVRPTSGRVLFEGREVVEPGPERAVVFQDPTLFPWLNVRQNVEFGLASAAVPREQRQARAAECLRLVGLTDCDDLYPHALSGGMRQRAALARVLALDPKALLMDEPFGALDANSRERLQDELLRLWQHHPRTVMFVTHSVEEAAYLADRIILMGPPPGSIRAEVPVPLARPRDRLSQAVQAIVQKLRDRLDDLPCCLAPACRRPVDEP
jgi:NitT/TauT family transport system ATP-binding protein